MSSATQAAPVSTKKLWTGRTFSTLAILFLLMDGIMKLFNPAPVVEGMIRLGYPLSLTATIGSFCSRLLWFMRFHIRQF